jgi:hypothetical protein
MERYAVGDAVTVYNRGPGCIRAVARPRHRIDDACAPVMAHLGRLSLQGKRFRLPRPHVDGIFTGAVTQYLVETEQGLDWVGWHLVRRLKHAGPMPWTQAFPLLLNWTPDELIRSVPASQRRLAEAA